MSHTPDSESTISIKNINYKDTIKKAHQGNPNRDIHPLIVDGQTTATVKTHRHDEITSVTIQDDAANDSTVTSFGAPWTGLAGLVPDAVSIDGDEDGIFAVELSGWTVTVKVDDNTNLAVGTYDLTVSIEYLETHQRDRWTEATNYVPRPDVLAFRNKKLRVAVEAA